MNKVLKDMLPPQTDAVHHTQHLYGGMTREVYDTGVEHPYPDGRVIISRTDLDGIITFVNDAFVEISGYTEEELLGAPHSILRHPDMPAVAFAGLWDTILAGEKWHGYVKNLCKDGGHYWVYATVVPNVRHGKIVGYTSVRREPSRSKIEEMSALYATLKAEEKA